MKHKVVLETDWISCSYVVGRLCFFAILENQSYVLSQAFDITKIADLQQVIFCLRKIKELVL